MEWLDIFYYYRDQDVYDLLLLWQLFCLLHSAETQCPNVSGVLQKKKQISHVLNAGCSLYKVLHDLKGRSHVEYLSVDERIILKLILKEYFNRVHIWSVTLIVFRFKKLRSIKCGEYFVLFRFNHPDIFRPKLVIFFLKE
jgi:hypothetical protein